MQYQIENCYLLKSVVELMGQSRKLMGQSRKIWPGCAGRGWWAGWNRDRVEGWGRRRPRWTGRRVGVGRARDLSAYTRHPKKGPLNFARG